MTKTVWAMYFSATGTTARVVRRIAARAAAELCCAYQEHDFTLPQARQSQPAFSAEDLVIFGTPTYAGRVPNVLLPYIGQVRGNGARAAAVVLFGNRDFDDSLLELRDLLAQGDFLPVACAAFVGEHSFSLSLAAGRPDMPDMDMAEEFAIRAANTSFTGLPEVDGTPKPYRGYYQPRDRAGNPVDIRRVKPKTDEECDDCGLCAKICPMGSIDPQNVRAYVGICVKCGACVKKCPRGAKYYDDTDYLYHKAELEQGLKRRAAVRLYY